jgi:hypothetical protein
MSHGSGGYRSTCHLPSCNSSCISGDPQLWAPSSTGADDDNNITSSSLSGLGRARASHHCCPLAPAFHPASSHLQWQGWVLGPSSSSSLFPLLSPCPHSCCPVLIPSSPHLFMSSPSPVSSLTLFGPLSSSLLSCFISLSAFHGSFPLTVSICPIAPCFHPMSSCLWQWLGVLWWWWLPLWLVGCCLVVA